MRWNCTTRRSPIHCRPRRSRRGDGECCADEGEVAERLRKLPTCRCRGTSYSSASRPRSFQTEKPLEEPAGLLQAAVVCERADEPERAGKELALVARQPVVGFGGRVAGDEAVAAELARDRVDRAADALVGTGEEADERDGEDARVELLDP